MVQAAMEAGANEFIVRLKDGYDTDVSTGSLSGGQKQRISIARVLLRKPRVLIFDEATSALDPLVQQQIMETINKLIASRHYTVLIISHRLQKLPPVDNIFVLRHGSIVERGTEQQLLADSSSTFAALYELDGRSDP